MGKVRRLMDEITSLDVVPSVFSVSLHSWDCSAGYFTASAQFRQGHGETNYALRAGGATPGEALSGLKAQIVVRYGNSDATQ